MNKKPFKVEHRLIEVGKSLTSSGVTKGIKSLVSSGAVRDKGELGLLGLGDSRQGKYNA